MEDFEEKVRELILSSLHFAMQFNGFRYLSYHGITYESKAPSHFILSLLALSNRYGSMFNLKIERSFNNIVIVTAKAVKTYTLRFCESLMEFPCSYTEEVLMNNEPSSSVDRNPREKRFTIDDFIQNLSEEFCRSFEDKLKVVSSECQKENASHKDGVGQASDKDSFVRVSDKDSFSDKNSLKRTVDDDEDVGQTRISATREDVLKRPSHDGGHCSKQTSAKDCLEKASDENIRKWIAGKLSQTKVVMEKDDGESKMSKFAHMIAFGNVFAVYLHKRRASKFIDLIADTLLEFIKEYQSDILKCGGWKAFSEHCAKMFLDLKTFGEVLDR